MCQCETVIYIFVKMTLWKLIFFYFDILSNIQNDLKNRFQTKIRKGFHFLNKAYFFAEFLKLFDLHGEVPSEPHIFTESSVISATTAIDQKHFVISSACQLQLISSIKILIKYPVVLVSILCERGYFIRAEHSIHARAFALTQLRLMQPNF